jgi:hypothetical protein
MEYWDFPSEDIAKSQRQWIAGFVESVPEIESHIDPDYLRWKEWSEIDGTLFMGAMLRVCDRLADDANQVAFLAKVFGYLEGLAAQLSSPAESKELSELDFAACKFLLFTFTDNPTGKGTEFRRLSAYMGPRILKMCSIIP